ncbi:YheC/YheD family protein [Thalassorhabdus alkalitolerans]|uniref:YheC/YheD family protein n=1 Tax=Thalassorhabdus alkalitolerans TaxID=2282697 RepID=A0ABW0YH44_9BACI
MRYTGGSKWKKHQLMQKRKELQPHLPATEKYTHTMLLNFLKEYNQVMVKPVIGRRGRNILKVTQLENNKFEVQERSHKVTYSSRDKMLAFIYKYISTRKHPLQRNYIVQRYIDLAEYNNSPFDIRVIVQKRKVTKNWEATGMVTKVAGKGYIVTNNKISKGIILPVPEALKKASIDPSVSRKKIMEEAERVSLLAAKRLAVRWKKHTIMGFDIGVDKGGHVWVIEGNLCPGIRNFNKLTDKTMYRRIKKIRKEHEKRVPGTS